MRLWPCCQGLRWLTLALWLLATLAPAAARVLAKPQPPLEICRAAAPRAQADDARPQAALAQDAQPGFLRLAADDAAARPWFDHCPFCLPVAERLGPPPAALSHFFNADSGLAPPHEQALLHPEAARARPRARAPPPLS